MAAILYTRWPARLRFLTHDSAARNLPSSSSALGMGRLMDAVRADRGDVARRTSEERRWDSCNRLRNR